MKFALFAVFTLSVLFSVLTLPELAAQNEAGVGRNHTFYVVKKLSTLGGTQGVGEAINNKGWISGAANLAGDSTEHAAIWRNGRITDLGTLGGPNSRVVGGVKNTRGIVAGGSETSVPDPFGETVCSTFVAGFSGQPLVCVGFMWRNGVMTALPTLGGNNGFGFGGVNNREQIVGFAENSTQDPACPSPQVLDFEAVIWGPDPGQIQELPPFSGDTVGIAAEMNDHGQAVGVTGLCSALSTAISHAVLWQNGSAMDLGNLGSHLFNWAYTINERGQVAGAAGVTGDTTWHAFLWDKGVMSDLGVLSGDVMSQSSGMNNKGQIVGTSCNDTNFDICHAFLWQGGAMFDLNDLISRSSPLQLVIANDINDRGEIAGYAYDPSTGDGPGFLAIPCDQQHAEVEGCEDQVDGATTRSSRSDKRPNDNSSGKCSQENPVRGNFSAILARLRKHNKGLCWAEGLPRLWLPKEAYYPHTKSVATPVFISRKRIDAQSAVIRPEDVLHFNRNNINDFLEAKRRRTSNVRTWSAASFVGINYCVRRDLNGSLVLRRPGQVSIGCKRV